MAPTNRIVACIEHEGKQGSVSISEELWASPLPVDGHGSPVPSAFQCRLAMVQPRAAAAAMSPLALQISSSQASAWIQGMMMMIKVIKSSITIFWKLPYNEMKFEKLSVKSGRKLRRL